MAADRPHLPHHPGLDGLRGLAVAAVLAYHGGFESARGGYLGVSVFFTLSGFLITSLLVAEHDRSGTISLRSFWSRRFRRLLPAALVALAGICVFGATVATPDQQRDLGGDVAAAVAYVANWRFIVQDVTYGDLFAEPSPVLHFWSLAIEEQFYVLFPALVLLVLRASRGRLHVLGAVVLALAAASVGASFLLSGSGQDRIYFGTDTRAVEVLVGALLALAISRWGRPAGRVAGSAATVAATAALGALAVAAVRVEQSSEWLYRGGFGAIALLSALVVLGAAREGRFGELLGNPPLRWLGLRSYGLYLYHWPIFLWLDPSTTGREGMPLFLLRLAVTAVVAEVSYHVVEMPFRRGRTGGKVRIRAGAVRAAVPTVAAAVVIAGLAVSAAAPVEVVAFGEVGEEPPPPPTPVTQPPEQLLVLGGPLASRVAQGLDDATAPDDHVEVLDGSSACQGPCAHVLDDWGSRLPDADQVVIVLGPDDPFAGDRAAIEQLRASATDASVTWVTHPVVGIGTEAAPADPERVAAHDAMRATLSDVAQHHGDEVIDLARLVEPPPEGSPPARIVISVPAGGEELAEATRQVVDQILAGVAAAPGTVRILVVGDSISQTLGVGVEMWAAETDQAVVWNAARPGCALLRDGDILDLGPMPVGCTSWADFFAQHVQDFAPDVVVLHSGPWDLARRRFADEGPYIGPGDAVFDDYMREEYDAVVDTLTAGGASIIWVRSACVAPQLVHASEVFSAERRAIQDGILAEIAASDPRVHLFDLDAVACPGGEYDRTVAGVADARYDGVHFSPDSAAAIADQHLASLVHQVIGGGSGSRSSR